VNTRLRSALLEIAVEHMAIMRARDGRLYRPGDNRAEQLAFAAVADAFQRDELPSRNLAAVVVALAALLDERAVCECS
jgi:hypothetical protein